METDWKEKYRRKLSDYSEPAPDGLFDEIMAACDAGAEVKPGYSRKTAVLLISGMAAAAAVALGVFCLPHGDYGADNDAYVADAGVSREEISIAVPVENGPKREETAAAASGLPAVGIEETGITESAKTEYMEQPEKEHPGNTDSAHSGNGPNNKEKRDTVSGYGGQSAEDAAKENVMSEETGVKTREKPEYAWDRLLAADIPDRKPRRKPVLSIYASGAGGSRDHHTGYSQAVNTMAASEPMVYGQNALAGIMAFNLSKDVSTESRHWLPVRAGISVSYAFTPHWSIGSGAVYSYLFSTSRTGSDSYYMDSRQALHYLGIPLNVSYSIWDSRWVRIYVSAGGTMEKCVGGSVRKNYVYNGEIRDAHTDKATVRQLQWSVSASAGLQINCSGLVGIYLEPGASYHFRNGSETETVYSDHPLNFSLNLGLRFSFE